MNLDSVKDFLLNPMSGFLSFNDDSFTDEGVVERRNGRIFITIDGMTKTLSEWSFYVDINRNTLYSRLRRGWSVADALYTPVKKREVKDVKESFTKENLSKGYLHMTDNYNQVGNSYYCAS